MRLLNHLRPPTAASGCSAFGSSAASDPPVPWAEGIPNTRWALPRLDMTKQGTQRLQYSDVLKGGQFKHGLATIEQCFNLEEAAQQKIHTDGAQGRWSQEVRGRLTRSNSQMSKSNVKEDCALEIDRWAGNWASGKPNARSVHRVHRNPRGLQKRAVGHWHQRDSWAVTANSIARMPLPYQLQEPATLQRRRRMQRRKRRRMTTQAKRRATLFVTLKFEPRDGLDRKSSLTW